MDTCAICNRPVDVTKKRGFCREEVGWAEVRVKGGTNSLKGRKATGRVAHLNCVKHGAMEAML